MRLVLAVTAFVVVGCLTGCSGASEGTTDAAAENVRKEMPKEYKAKELPEDKDMHVFGRDKVDSGSTAPTTPKSGG